MSTDLHPQLAGTSFASYRPRTASQWAALQQVERWVAEADAGHGGAQLALLGGPGVGKSHLLYAAAAALYRDRGRSVYCAPWSRLAVEMPCDSADSWRRLQVLMTHRIVLIDEVNAGHGGMAAIGNITSWCYDERIPLLITSNAHPLASLIGAPAASRFTEVIVSGPDARKGGT